MQIKSLSIPDIKLVCLEKHADDRGYFLETFRKQKFEEDVGQSIDFVQDNRSFSKAIYTVRGLHCQVSPYAQGKLVQCTRGRIVDIAVDVRDGSPTFGQSVRKELRADDLTQLWVPAGFLHGFATLDSNTEVHYKCTNYYAPECAFDVFWNDPDLGIDWGFDTSHAVLSKKDANAMGFKEFVNSL